MADHFTAPVAGTYHVSTLGAPHLVAECGPLCEPFPGMPVGSTTHLEFDQIYLRRPDLSEEQAARFAAEFDAALKAEPKHRVRLSPPSFAPVDFREFSIGVFVYDDTEQWVQVAHKPCGADVYSGKNGPEWIDAATVWTLITQHKCAGRTDDTASA